MHSLHRSAPLSASPSPRARREAGVAQASCLLLFPPFPACGRRGQGDAHCRLNLNAPPTSLGGFQNCGTACLTCWDDMVHRAQTYATIHIPKSSSGHWSLSLHDEILNRRFRSHEFFCP